ncbi:MAG: hypothetical protein L0Y72_17645 [Gemmataceae bacterium]|nr:hypothetical protein [Gemmataceae bacterium]MCI0740876.1 hypothetical protein [Gemmataceae bacterium]
MPISTACGACGQEYLLKDELAGASVRCRNCQATFRVPEARIQPPPLPAPADDDDTAVIAPPAKSPPMSSHLTDPDDDDTTVPSLVRSEMDPVFDRDQFLLRQKHFSISEKYFVCDEEGDNIMFVERPLYFAQTLGAVSVFFLAFLLIVGLFAALGFLLARGLGRADQIAILFAAIGVLPALAAGLAVFVWIMPKRHIHFYPSERKKRLLLEIRQDKKVMILNATYTVLDPDGQIIGSFRKNYLYNFFRKRWYGYGPDGDEILVAMEDSLALSLLRRFLGPMFGVLRTNFIILKPDGETLLGTFDRKFTILDRYVLDVSPDRKLYLDRRLAIALGVLLDTGEHR